MQTHEPQREASWPTRTARRCFAFLYSLSSSLTSLESGELRVLYINIAYTDTWSIVHPQIHYIADNIMCCGAGTAADTEFTTAEIRSQIALHKLNTGREPRVVTAMTMLKQKLFQ